MAVRQYVGARYVPKYFENPDGTNDWLQGIAYEPLTIVTYGGNTFTSKIPVPSTVGTPNLNTNYWAISQSSGYDPALKKQVDENTENIESLQNKTSKLGCAIYIGNSFTEGVGSTSGNEGLYNKTKYLFENSYVGIAGSSGFLANQYQQTTFLQLLINVTSELSEIEKNKITHIIFNSAVGDSVSLKEKNYVFTDLNTAILNCYNYIKQNFPNATMYINYCEGVWSATEQINYGTKEEFILHKWYQDYLANINVVYLGWTGWSITLKQNLFVADHIHPNDSGYNILATNLINTLAGNFNYEERKQVLTNNNGATVFIMAKPDSCSLNFSQATSEYNSGETGLISVFDYSKNLIFYTKNAIYFYAYNGTGFTQILCYFDENNNLTFGLNPNNIIPINGLINAILLNNQIV